MKKNNPIITLLLIAFTPMTFGMEPESKNDKPKWLTLAADSLLRNTTTSKKYSTKTLEQFLFQDVEFDNLSLAEQAEIIFFLNNNDNASTLQSAAHIINSLAKVNKQLDTLINTPQFCLQLIKRFEQQFNCSDEIATQALQTKEAQNRLAIQKTFKNLFAQWDFDIKEFNKLYNQYKDYVDLNFTYQHSDRYDTKNTLLIDSAMYASPYKTVKIESLLNTGKVNVNYQNARKETTLIACAYTCDNPAVLQSLCKVPNLLIDLQDKEGNTALMATCLSRENKNLQKGCIFTLLHAGANPKIANNAGRTPLNVNKNVKFMEDAIDKRRHHLIQETIKQHQK